MPKEFVETESLVSAKPIFDGRSGKVGFAEAPFCFIDFEKGSYSYYFCERYASKRKEEVFIMIKKEKIPKFSSQSESMLN